jgi:protein TonB
MYLYEQPPASRRLASLSFVLLLHVATAYALVTGLARQAVESPPAPVETRLLDEIEPQAALPPPPLRPLPPFVVPATPDMPLPEIHVRQPVSSNAPGPSKARTASQPVVAVPREKPPESIALQPVPRSPARVSPHVEVGKNCLVPEYPAAAKAAGQTGSVALRFLVDTDGSVVESQVESSSGFPALDDAARAALSLCQFTPGTADGRPERSWARLRYVWKIR